MTTEVRSIIIKTHLVPYLQKRLSEIRKQFKEHVTQLCALVDSLRAEITDRF